MSFLNNNDEVLKELSNIKGLLIDTYKLCNANACKINSLERRIQEINHKMNHVEEAAKEQSIFDMTEEIRTHAKYLPCLGDKFWQTKLLDHLIKIHVLSGKVIERFR